MAQITSKDGTTIAYGQRGAGTPIILVDCALYYRAYCGSRPLAAELSQEFKVITYDRRGRGASSDTPPYAVVREIEDIAALIDAVGSPVYLYGSSSGAALALKAAARLGDKVAKVALYEPPYSIGGDEARGEFARYTQHMNELLASNRRSEAIAFFLADMLPAEGIEEMRQSPEWSMMEAVAPTLAYDNAVMGDSLPPVDEARATTIPTLILDGGETLPFLREAADALAEMMPHAQRQTLAGQMHRPSPETIARVLTAFLGHKR